MKVKLFAKSLIKDYYAYLSVISVIATLCCIFGDVPEKLKFLSFVLFALALVIIYLVLWYRANKTTSISLSVNNSVLEIGVGDLSKESGYKVIAFNEYFDTVVGPGIISDTSMNGQYILQNHPDPESLDIKIEQDQHVQDSFLETVKRKYGKSRRYKLGTIYQDSDYFLVAFSRFDENNRAWLEINEYISCLLNMWNECDIYYNGKSVSVPLLGAGITRFRGFENITEQELLEIIIWTFKVSRIRFQYPSRMKIVLTENSLSKINLYEIKKRFT